MPSNRHVRVIAPTGESSEVENNALTRRRQLVHTAQVPQHGSRSTPRPLVSNVLKRAIDKLDVETLRTWVNHYREANQGFTNYLESGLLVRGKDMVRYHVDSASEDDELSEIESEDETSKLRPIAVADSEKTAKYAKCINCREEFDVTVNNRGDLHWHSGEESWNC
jgi:hypothetical protein